MSTYYRGDTSRPERPELTAGTWLAESSDVAAWYGAAHRYDIPALRLLDLTDLGVGGDMTEDEDGSMVPDPVYVERVEDALREHGLEPTFDVPVELYMLLENADFRAAALAAGYEGVRAMQWHAEMDDEPYVAVMLLTDMS